MDGAVTCIHDGRTVCQGKNVQRLKPQQSLKLAAFAFRDCWLGFLQGPQEIENCLLVGFAEFVELLNDLVGFGGGETIVARGGM